LFEEKEFGREEVDQTEARRTFFVGGLTLFIRQCRSSDTHNGLVNTALTLQRDSHGIPEEARKDRWR
jgi:hypothetical protein